jgi:hypothetical protein
MKQTLVLIAAIAMFVPTATRVLAGDRTCGQPSATCENTCQCEKCRPAHTHCCCLRSWFVLAEPPDVDVLEAVALRRVPAPVSSAALQFQIRAVPSQPANAQAAVDPACSVGAVAPAASAATEANCKSATEVQELKARMELIDSRLSRVMLQLEEMAKKKAGK